MKRRVLTVPYLSHLRRGVEDADNAVYGVRRRDEHPKLALSVSDLSGDLGLLADEAAQHMFVFQA
ncbi:hypothetical protein [Methylobacterium sp. CM6247]